MNTPEQSVEAQGYAILHGGPWRKHLVSPVELKYLFLSSDRRTAMSYTLEALRDLALCEDAPDRSDTALISAVRELVTLAKEYEDYLQEQKFRGGAE